MYRSIHSIRSFADSPSLSRSHSARPQQPRAHSSISLAFTSAASSSPLAHWPPRPAGSPWRELHSSRALGGRTPRDCDLVIDRFDDAAEGGALRLPRRDNFGGGEMIFDGREMIFDGDAGALLDHGGWRDMVLDSPVVEWPKCSPRREMIFVGLSSRAPPRRTGGIRATSLCSRKRGTHTHGQFECV